jgi:hypothetical protein
MPASPDVIEKALALPTESRALLVEKLLASLAGEVNSAVERQNLEEVRKRRVSAGKGNSKLVNGKAAIAKARAAMRK